MAIIDMSFADIPNFDSVLNPEKLAESLFSIGLTDRKKIVDNGFEIQVGESDSNFASSVEPVANTRWVFLNNERTLALHVYTNRLILKCTDYDVFGNFKDIFNRCVEALKKELPLLSVAPLKRVGTRYVSLVMPKPEHQVDSYIDEKWLAPKTLIDVEPSRKLMLSRLTQFIEDGNVKIKVDSTQFEPANGMQMIVIPDDLSDHEDAALQLKFVPWMQHAVEAKKSYFILDIDAFIDAELDNVGNGISEILDNLRPAVRTCFNAYVTDCAEKEWGEKL